IRGGKIVDTYTIPTNITRSDGKRDLSEFDDIHLLSNGDLVYACKTGAGRLDKNHNLIWEMQCLPNFECHSCQPIDLDRVFVCINGLPPRCMIVNTKTNKVEMEHELPCKDPTSQSGVHGQFRHIRMTKDGTYLIAALGMGKVIEYDKD